MNIDNNILLIDKPADWTSFDVVAKIRNAYRKETRNKKAKVGHAGTLDPFATGLLIVLLGEATKQQDSFMKQDKEYEATLKLGYTSTTGDPEGEIIPYSSSEAKRNREASEFSTPPCSARTITREAIATALQALQGEIFQTPPIYSAIKVDGKRAYQLARQGQKIELEPRKVTIFELEIREYSLPELKIRVKCSSGTYVRTLAEDIGKALGCGAYLTALRRTKIGEFDTKDAITIEEAIKSFEK